MYLRLRKHGNSGRGKRSSANRADDLRTVKRRVRAHLLCWIDQVLKQSPHLSEGQEWNRQSLAAAEPVEILPIYQSLSRARQRRGS